MITLLPTLTALEVNAHGVPFTISHNHQVFLQAENTETFDGWTINGFDVETARVQGKNTLCDANGNALCIRVSRRTLIQDGAKLSIPYIRATYNGSEFLHRQVR